MSGAEITLRTWSGTGLVLTFTPRQDHKNLRWNVAAALYGYHLTHPNLSELMRQFCTSVFYQKIEETPSRYALGMRCTTEQAEALGAVLPKFMIADIIFDPLQEPSEQAMFNVKFCFPPLPSGGLGERGWACFDFSDETVQKEFAKERPGVSDNLDLQKTIFNWIDEPE